MVFDYQKSRAREGPETFLKEFRGTLQTDGYTAYNKLGEGDSITLLACMAHERRCFEKALENDRVNSTRSCDFTEVIAKFNRMNKHMILNRYQLINIAKNILIEFSKNGIEENKYFDNFNDYKNWINTDHMIFLGH